MQSPDVSHSGKEEIFLSFVDMASAITAHHPINCTGLTQPENIREYLAQDNIIVSTETARTIAKYLFSIHASKRDISFSQFLTELCERVSLNRGSTIDQSYAQMIAETLSRSVFSEATRSDFLEIVNYERAEFREYVSLLNSQHYTECASIIDLYHRHHSSTTQGLDQHTHELIQCFFDGLESPNNNDSDFVQALYTASYLSGNFPETFGRILLEKTNSWTAEDSIDSIFSQHLSDIQTQRRIFARATLELISLLPLGSFALIPTNNRRSFVSLLGNLLLSHFNRKDANHGDEPKRPLSIELRLIDIMVRHSAALSIKTITDMALWDVPNQHIDSKKNFPTQEMFAHALQYSDFDQSTLLRIATSECGITRKISLFLKYEEARQKGDHNLHLIEPLNEKIEKAIRSCDSLDTVKVVQIALHLIGKNVSYAALLKPIFDISRNRLIRQHPAIQNEDIKDTLHVALMSFFSVRLKLFPSASTKENLEALVNFLIDGDCFNYFSSVALYGSVSDKEKATKAFLEVVSLCKESGDVNFEISALRVISDSTLSNYPHSVWGLALLGDYPLSRDTPKEALKKLREYLYAQMKRFHDLYFDKPQEITPNHRKLASLWLKTMSIIFTKDQRISTEVFDDAFLLEVEKLCAYSDTCGFQLKEKVLRARKNKDCWEEAVIYECCEQYLFSEPRNLALWNQRLTLFLNSDPKHADFPIYFCESILHILKESSSFDLTEDNRSQEENSLKQLERRCFELIRSHRGRSRFSKQIIDTGLAGFLWREILPIAKKYGHLHEWRHILPTEYFD